MRNARWQILVALLALAAMTGCQGFSTGNSTTPTKPPATLGQVTVTPASINFGKVQVGYNLAQTIKITNSGGSAVSVTQATLTGAGFSLNGLSLPLNLSAGQNQSFSVVFTPKSGSSSSGNLAIVNNGSTSPVNVGLSGNGQTDGTLTVSPTSLNFGSVQLGSNEPLSETLTNTGGSSITISQAAVSGTGFTTSGLTLPLTLPAGQSQPFTVTFTPQSGGSSSGNLAITSTGSISNINVPLSGDGLTAGSLSPNPASINFGNVQVGHQQSSYETLTNSNGSTSVTVSQVEASGTGFAIAGLTTPLVIAPGQHYTFSVTFTPSAAGSESGSIEVSSNASNPTLTIPLMGTGDSAPTSQLSVSPATINFGSVTEGSNASQPASLNATGAAVTVTADALSNSAFSVSGLTFPVTIPAGQGVPFTVTFTPQTSGPVSGTLSFTSNASTSSGASLSGSGTPASHTVNLNWKPSSSQDINGYNIYRGVQTGGPYSKINPSLDATTNYIDSTVSDGQTYYYVTTAVNSSNEESGYSNEAKAVIPAN